MRSSGSALRGAEPTFVRQKMTETQRDKSRVAIAIFDDTKKIQFAYRELIEIGSDSQDLYIVGQKGGIVELLENEYSFEQISLDPNQIPLKYSNQPISDVNSQKLLERENQSRDFSKFINFKIWMVKKLYKNIEEHLKQGHCLVIVFGLTLENEQAVFKVLSSYAIDRIQIHDYE